MVSLAKKGCLAKVVITYKDRLTRFGFLFLKRYLREFGVSLEVLHTLDTNTPQTELVEDLIAIVHSFSGKMYRMRREKK